MAYFGRLLMGLVTWLCVMLMAMTSPLAQNSVTSMRIGAVTVDEAPGLRLVVETRLPLEAQLSLLRDPYRLVIDICLLYTSPSPRDGLLSRMPSSA